MEWDDDRVDALRSGKLAGADLFGKEQRRFLQQCSPGWVNLEALVALADITATRWDEFRAKVDGPGGALGNRRRYGLLGIVNCL
jgi:hypothetical protein